MSAISPVSEEEFYIAAIDQGTSSSRVMVYDSKGQQVASHQVSIPHIKPKPGYVTGFRYFISIYQFNSLILNYKSFNYLTPHYYN